MQEHDQKPHYLNKLSCLGKHEILQIMNSEKANNQINHRAIKIQ